MKRFFATLLGLVLLVVVGFWWASRSEDSAKLLVTKIFAEAGVQIGGSEPWDIVVHNEMFYPEVVGRGSLGLGESYMTEMWDSPAVDQFIYHLLTADVEERWSLQVFTRWLQASLFNLQNRARSQEVINIHYNLGNDLYEKMLGPTMAYSCGYWKEATNLNEAQEAKYDLICRKLKLEKGMHLLDIGCGFGGLAKFAAEHYGVHVTGITLSENQATYAKKMCEGLDVEIRIEDYRDLVGEFDRIVSVGMFEHVGPKNYPEFMQICNRCLKSRGLFLLHTIGKSETSTGSDPWISTYIFPGGVLPSPVQISQAAENIFVLEDWHNFGPDYDKTLMAWHANFLANWDSLSGNYSHQFYRMWNYYLLSCAAAFRSRDCQLWQIVFSKERLVKYDRSS